MSVVLKATNKTGTPSLDSVKLFKKYEPYTLSSYILQVSLAWKS